MEQQGNMKEKEGTQYNPPPISTTVVELKMPPAPWKEEVRVGAPGIFNSTTNKCTTRRWSNCLVNLSISIFSGLETATTVSLYYH
mmetsp:Transcript_31768/g.34134  ORF Transcript_31768/g.34134 Transcript_31768/m.34134 type:complete len:85 (-) Transcript_31768:395-649(-)